MLQDAEIAQLNISKASMVEEVSTLKNITQVKEKELLEIKEREGHLLQTLASNNNYITYLREEIWQREQERTYLKHVATEVQRRLSDLEKTRTVRSFKFVTRWLAYITAVLKKITKFVNG